MKTSLALGLSDSEQRQLREVARQLAERLNETMEGMIRVFAQLQNAGIESALAFDQLRVELEYLDRNLRPDPMSGWPASRSQGRKSGRRSSVTLRIDPVNRRPASDTRGLFQRVGCRMARRG